MTEENHCSQCGAELPADTPQGQCPQCLMKLGLPTGAEVQDRIIQIPIDRHANAQRDGRPRSEANGAEATRLLQGCRRGAAEPVGLDACRHSAPSQSHRTAGQSADYPLVSFDPTKTSQHEEVPTLDVRSERRRCYRQVRSIAYRLLLH